MHAVICRAAAQQVSLVPADRLHRGLLTHRCQRIRDLRPWLSAGFAGMIKVPAGRAGGAGTRIAGEESPRRESGGTAERLMAKVTATPNT